MTIGALTIITVEPGTVITDPTTGMRHTVDDTGAVVDQRTGKAWMTPKQYDVLKELIGKPAGAS